MPAHGVVSIEFPVANEEPEQRNVSFHLPPNFVAPRMPSDLCTSEAMSAMSAITLDRIWDMVDSAIAELTPLLARNLAESCSQLVAEAMRQPSPPTGSTSFLTTARAAQPRSAWRSVTSPAAHRRSQVTPGPPTEARAAEEDVTNRFLLKFGLLAAAPKPVPASVLPNLALDPRKEDRQETKTPPSSDALSPASSGKPLELGKRVSQYCSCSSSLERLPNMSSEHDEDVEVVSLPVLQLPDIGNVSDELRFEGKRSESKRSARSGRSESPGSGVHRTITQVMHGCVTDLAREAASVTQAAAMGASVRDGHQKAQDPPVGAVPTALFVLGVLPWNRCRHSRWSTAYQVLVRVVLLGASIAFILHNFNEAAPRDFENTEFQSAVTQLPLAIGSGLGLCTFGFGQRAEKLKDTFELLRAVARERGFNEWHVGHMRIPGLVHALLWVSCMTAYVARSWIYCTEATPERIVVDGVWLAMFAGTLLSMSFAMACLCRSLNALVDSFCCDAADFLLVSEISYVWNVAQAVVRKTSQTIEHCMVVFGLVVAVVVPLTLIETVGFGSIAQALPAFFVACGPLYVLLLAARVSEKCTRVPALINAISFGPGTDRTRQHVVDYIVSSGAGFYVLGMRVTPAMVLKFAYGWSVVACGFGARFVQIG